MARRTYSAAFLAYVRTSAGRVPVDEILATAAGLYDTPVSKGQLYQLCHLRRWSLMAQAFSGHEVARLMGVAYVTVRAYWLAGDPPPLASRAQPAPGSIKRQWWVTPGDLYQFLYRHPTAYDWRTIAREPWRSHGRRATERAGVLFASEVSARLGIPPATLADWVARYEIPGVVRQRAGRVRWRFRPEALPPLRALQRTSYRKRDRGVPARAMMSGDREARDGRRQEQRQR